MSLSLDFTGLLKLAGTIINDLWPVFLIPIGIGLGMKLLDAIVKAIRSAI
jgi:hypothetical protein